MQPGHGGALWKPTAKGKPRDGGVQLPQASTDRVLANLHGGGESDTRGWPTSGRRSLLLCRSKHSGVAGARVVKRGCSPGARVASSHQVAQACKAEQRSGCGHGS